jgi:hypothetical protein
MRVSWTNFRTVTNFVCNLFSLDIPSLFMLESTSISLLSEFVSLLMSLLAFSFVRKDFVYSS